MSTTVDERVVEMRFDNKHFESNVSTSMSTLDKLKQKLNFSGASKGLEEIDAASKKIDMSSLGSAVGAVGAKFSALQVVAVTALANITNSAVNAGKQLISSLSIDQLTAGWQKFSDKTTSVATLVAQGNAIEDVNDQLDRLNWFTDETSYNFTEMVSNIAKFTATGKGLTESVTAMEGIATWAALSGQNAATASRAMYQLSQAMGAGVMRLEDYKSIQNASMDTEEFRTKCIEAGIALGTLKDNGDGTYSSLVDGASGASWTISQFATNLTKEMWLTSDVMMSVFNTYSSAVEGIYNAAEEKGMLASEIIDEIYTTAESKSISTDEAIQLLGYDFDSFALKAFEAAQKARTFNDAIESVKDAVSTGWMKTFELIFGDAEKATELWTDLANTLWDVFAAGGEIRNTILEFALNFTKPWTTIYEKLQGIDKTFSKVTDTVKTATDKLEYFQDIVNKVWRGDYNNRGDNPDRFDLLTAAGYNSSVVQELVNKGYQYELTVEDVEAAHKKFGLTMETTTEETKDLVEATNEVTSAYTNLTDAQLEEAGLTEDEISLYRAMEKEAKRLGISVEDLADKMSKNNGRTLLIDSFKNAGNGLLGILQAIKEAWKEIFGDPTVGEQAVKLYSLIESLNNFSKKLRLTDEETGKLNETGEKLKRTFKGIFAIVDIITTILGGAFKIVLKVIGGVLDALGINILDVTASLGDMLVAFRDWLLEDNVFAQAIMSLIDNLISKIPVVIEKFKEWFGVLRDWFNTFKETPAVQKFIDAIQNIGDALKKLFTGEITLSDFAAILGENLGNALASIPSMAFQVGKDFIAGFGKGLLEGVGGIILSVINFCENFISSFASALGVQSPSWIAEGIASDFFQGFINGAKNAFGAVVGVLKKIGEGIVDVFRSLWDFLTDEEGNIEWGKIFAAGSIVALIFVLKKFTDTFVSVTNLVDSISGLLDECARVVKNFGKVLNSISWDIKAEALKKMAIAIALLVASIWVLTTIDDVGKLWNAVGVIAVLAIILIGLSVAMDKLSAASVKWDKGLQIEGIKSGLLQIGIAILLVAAAVKMIGDMDAAKAERGFNGIITIAIGMVAMLAAIGGISRYSGNIEGIGKTMTKLAVAMLLMVVVCKLAAKLSAEEMGKGLLFIGALGGFIVGITSVAKGSQKDISAVGGMFVKLAIAMGLMVLVCKLAAKLSYEQMLKGGLFMFAFGGFVAAITMVTKTSNDKHIAKIGGLLLSMSTAMLLMVGVCKLAAKLSYDDMLKGAAFMAGFIVLMGIMVQVLKIGNEQKMANVAASIISMSAGIAVLAGICVLLSFLDEKSLIKGVTAVSILCAMMALMVRGLKGANEVKGTMMWMAIAITLMAAAVAALSFIDTKSLITATASMAVLMGMFALMIKSMSGLEKGKVAISAIATLTGVILVMAGLIFLLKDIDPYNAIGNVLALSTFMLAMTGVLEILTAKTINPKKALKSAISLSTLIIPLLLFAGALAVTNDIDPSIKTVATLTILMGAMAGLLQFLVMKTINPKKALKSALALTTLVIPLLAFTGVLGLMQVADIEANIATVTTLTLLMGAMAALMEFLLIFTPNMKRAFKAAVSLTTMAIPLLAFATVLSLMQAVNLDANIKTVVTLTLLMGAMAALMEFLVLMKPNITKAFKAAVSLTAMAIPLLAFAAVLWAMSSTGVENAVKNALALTILAGACSGMLVVLAFVGKMGLKNALKGVVALTAMALPLLTFIGVLALMDGVENAMANVKALVLLVSALTVLLIPLTLVGALIYPALMGVVALTAMALPMLAFVGVIALMNNVDNATENINLLLTMMTVMTGLLTHLAVIGPMALIGVTAMTGLAGLIAAIGIVATAIGALVQKFPSIEEFLNTGLPVLERLAGSIGTMIGNFISGLAGGIAEAMVKIANSLVEFISTLSVASLIADTIKPGSFDGVKDLLLVMLEIAGASAVTAIGDMFTMMFSGKSTMEKFVEDATTFMEGMKTICRATNGIQINQESFDAIIAAAQALADLQSSLVPMGGVIQWFSGEKNLGTFGESVADFIRSMKVAFKTLDGMTMDFLPFFKVLMAAQALSELQKDLEPIGGVVSWFAGRDDLGTFGENVADFIESMKEAFWTLEGMSYDQAAFKAVITATKSLSDLAGNLEPIGGVVTWFTGRSDLGTFGENVVEFFAAMKEAFTVLEGSSLDSNALAAMVMAVEALAPLASTIEPIGGVVTWFTGRSDLGTFGEGIVSFAEGMKKLAECGVIDSAAIDSMIPAAQKLSEFRNTLESTGGVVSWFAGEIDFESFGNGIYAFAKGMQAVSECGSINADSLQSLVDSGMKLAELESSLISHGGIFSIFGDNDLSQFGAGIVSFATGMKSISEVGPIDVESFGSIIEAAKALSTLESELSISIGGLTSFLTGISTQDLETFGQHVEAFMGSMKVAFNSMDGLNYNDEMFNNVITAAGKLNELESALKVTFGGGLLGLIIGVSNQDLGTFGENIETFMSSMKSAFVAMDGLHYDSEAFDSIIEAAGKLNELESSLSMSFGGVLGFFCGLSTQDLGTFGENIVLFAKGMQKLGECEALDETAINSIVSAAQSLSGIEKNLAPSFGGFLGFFCGLSTQDLGTFGENIGIFADGMIKLAECPGFDSTTLDSIVTAASSLGELQNELEGSVGGVISWFTGQDQNLGTFGESIGLFADGMQKLCSCEGFSEEKMTGILDAASTMQQLESKLDGSVGGVISWFTGQDQNLGTFGSSIEKFANGMKTLKECEGLNQDSLTTICDAAVKLQELESKLEGSVGGVVTWFTGQDQNLGTFGESIEKFGNGMLALKNCDGLTPELVATIIEAASGLKGITASMDENAGGLFDWFINNEKLKSFGEAIEPFATGMAKLTECQALDQETVESIVTAAFSLKGITDSLDENANGLFSWFIDNEYLKSFGEAIEPFATGMAKLTECQALDQETVDSLIVAATSIGGLTTTLSENVGGLVSYFVNSLKQDTLGKFGENIALFANGMGALNNALGENGFSAEAIASMTTAANEINNLQKALPDEGLFDTKMDLEEFSEYMTTFAAAITSMGTSASGLDSEAIDLLIRTAYRIKSFINTLADFDDEGLSTFAGGGWSDGAAVILAQAMCKFSEEAADIDATQTDSVLSSAERIKAFISSLTDLDTSGIEAFKPEEIGKAIQAYNTEVTGIDPTIVESSITLAERLRQVMVALAGTNVNAVRPFANALPTLGAGLQSYNGYIASTTPEKLISSVDAAIKLRDFILSLSDFTSGGVASFKDAVTELSTVNVADIVNAFAAATDDMEEVGLNLCKALVDGMSSNKRDVDTAISSIISSARGVAESWETKYSAVGKSLVSKIADGMDTARTEVTPVISTCMAGAISSIRGHYENFYNAGSYLVSGFKKGIKDNIAQAASAATAMALAAETAARAALRINSPSKIFEEIGSGIPEGFELGIESGDFDIEGAITSMTSSATDEANSGILSWTSDLSENGSSITSIFEDTGSDSGEGFISGLKSVVGKVKSIFTNETEEAVEATTDELAHYQDLVDRTLAGEFGTGYDRKNALTQMGENYATVQALINKVWERGGRSFSDTTITIDDLNEVLNSTTVAASTATDTMSETLDTLTKMAEEDMDITPVITPVIDLSEYETGMAALESTSGDGFVKIGGKFTNLSSLANKMNQNSQNGSDEVVKAIDGLGEKLENSNGDTYVINGITYDDNSAVSKAINELIRAVQIGERV